MLPYDCLRAAKMLPVLISHEKGFANIQRKSLLYRFRMVDCIACCFGGSNALPADTYYAGNTTFVLGD